jgi:hypothetical protein
VLFGGPKTPTLRPPKPRKSVMVNEARLENVYLCPDPTVSSCRRQEVMSNCCRKKLASRGKVEEESGRWRGGGVQFM